MRIVLDAMGGDDAPDVVVQGALAAARVHEDVTIVLTGPVALVRPLAEKLAGSPAELARLRIEIVDAPESVGMDELPLPAIRRKKRSSILVGLHLVRDGHADAFISAGNTGAIMAAATLVLGRLPGVERPALAALLPNAKAAFTLLVDVGANVEVRPQYLEQFAVMGSCFMQSVCAVENPRVALLSVGEEAIKGSDLIRKVHHDLKQGPVNFIGNIDGKDVYSGHADVIVTDGFTGNAILKSSESLVKALGGKARHLLVSSWRARIGYLLIKPVVKRLRKIVDHSETGAVPLLGVAAPVFIGHGSSTARGIASAVRVTRTFVDAKVNEAIEEKLRELERSNAAAEIAAEPGLAAGRGGEA